MLVGNEVSILTSNSPRVRNALLRTPAWGSWRSLLAVVGLLAAMSVCAQEDGGADADFIADTNGGTGYVNVVTLQPAVGKILVGGSFSTINGSGSANIVRLNRLDGSVDGSFAASVSDPDGNAEVNALTVQSNGQILVGGTFTQVNGQLRNNVARLNADGSLDTAFNPDVGGSVYAIVQQSDGKIFIGGTFNTVGSASRASLARLTAITGSLDTSFIEINEFVSSVQALLVLPSGNLVTGWKYSADGAFVIVSLDSHGNKDPTFNVTMDPADSTASLDNSLATMAWQPDGSAGKIIIGGKFQTINGAARSCIARVNAATGSLDPAYNPNLGANCYAESVLRKADNSVFVSGAFSTVSGEDRIDFARLKVNGQLDVAFDATSSPSNDVGGVASMAQQPDGQIVVGGIFSKIGGGRSRVNIARIFDDKMFANGFD